MARERTENNRFFRLNKRFQEILTTIAITVTVIVPASVWGASKVGDIVVKKVDIAMTVRFDDHDNRIKGNYAEITIIKADLNQGKIDRILKQASKIKDSSNDDIKFSDIENAIRDYNHIELDELDRGVKTSLDVAYHIILEYYRDNKYK